jgi:hypothetical protein
VALARESANEIRIRTFSNPSKINEVTVSSFNKLASNLVELVTTSGVVPHAARGPPDGHGYINYSFTRCFVLSVKCLSLSLQL